MQIQLKKYIYLILLLFSTLSGFTQTKHVNLIIYTPFVHPKTTYDSIVHDFIQTGLLDSMKVIGMPLYESNLKIELDSVRLNKMGISVDEARLQVNKLVETCADVNELMRQYITSPERDKIPLSAVATFKVIQVYYKPDIFIISPDVYYHKGREAVKIELYCTKRNGKKMIQFIQMNLQNYADRPGTYYNEIYYNILWSK